MTRVALIALFALAGATAHASDQAADEVKKLQGEWQAVEIETQGKKVSKDNPEVKNLRFVFDGQGITLPIPDGGGQGRKKTYKLDATKSPKEIDITSLDGQEKDQTAACIYKLDGDRLTICIPYFTKDPSIRPKEFKAGADDGIMVITLERTKAK
jgi:uncharacterized protein (TIGR03067 family)